MLRESHLSKADVMMTLRMFSRKFDAVPLTTAWYLAELGEARGKQELYILQFPQRLETLREHALIESAVSSNRIEGVEVEKTRIATVVFGKSLLRDRDEEEVRGYRQALTLIHEKKATLPVTEATILMLHGLTRGEIWDAGTYKDQDGDIIERFPDGSSRIRFKTVPAVNTPACMKDLIALLDSTIRASRIPPLVILAAFSLDFLCIHPFRDGNGRVSRLLMLLQCYHFGFEVGGYISLERLVEENKERYYETLEQSSQGWHGGRHDPWPYINFVLFILKGAYKEFEQRLDRVPQPKGEKTRLVMEAIDQRPGQFSVSDLRNACPSVSVDMIRRVLKKLRAEDRVVCLGRGQNAQWRKTDTWAIG